VAEEGETIDLLSAAPPAVMYVEAPTGLYYGAACFTGTYCGCMVLYVKAWGDDELSPSISLEMGCCSSRLVELLYYFTLIFMECSVRL
jgi:hypothetical protein